ncbi:MAG: pirin family protein, partial [Flavobacteriales bacterium]|nr:pirin family protein [Flavobacteriales bacterium]
LSTLTYLLSGEVMHRDSIGTNQRIKPGEVNLMIGGKGVAHTERTPEDLIGTSYLMNGYQIWIALPKDKEFMDPEFHHASADELETWNVDGADFKLIIGEGFDRVASLPQTSPMFIVEVKTKEAMTLDLKGQLKGEVGILVSEGSVKAGDMTIESGNLLVSKNEDHCSLEVGGDSLIFLIGGEPFPEKRFIEWNFVASSMDTIEQARANWDNWDWPKVEGDETYIARPKVRFKQK